MEGWPCPLQVDREATGRKLDGEGIDVGGLADEAAVRGKHLYEDRIDPINGEAVVGFVPRVVGHVEGVAPTQIGPHFVYFCFEHVGRILVHDQISTSPGD
jgi:hypothetical protein